MATWEFPCSDPIDVYVGIAAGSVTMTAELTDTVTVRAHQGRLGDASRETADADRLADDLSVDFENGKLDIREPQKRRLRHNKSLHLAISVPAESSCTIITASADARCLGEYSAVDVRTASGRVDVHSVRGRAEISTMSGGVQIDQATEPNVQSASGRILVRHATGDLMARTASGNISIGRADASVTARTASGEVLINSVARGRADLNSVSGDVRVRVARGTGVLLDLASVTGRVSSDLDPSDQEGQEGQEGQEDLQLHSRTVSGTIHVGRAVTADAAS